MATIEQAQSADVGRCGTPERPFDLLAELVHAQRVAHGRPVLALGCLKRGDDVLVHDGDEPGALSCHQLACVHRPHRWEGVEFDEQIVGGAESLAAGATGAASPRTLACRRRREPCCGAPRGARTLRSIALSVYRHHQTCRTPRRDSPAGTVAPLALSASDA